MNYIIFDLEATCWEKRDQSPNEIIEIGAVLIDENQKIVSEFVQFVKPVKHPILSDFCKKLTSIEQSDVDEAPYFPEAIEKFQKWMKYGTEPYVLCSWGFYDKKQLRSDCAIHNMNADWINRHISIKHQYAEIKQLKRPVGMPSALKKEGLSLDGTHHRGIDDARNIAKIFLRHFDQWSY